MSTKRLIRTIQGNPECKIAGCKGEEGEGGKEMGRRRNGEGEGGGVVPDYRMR